MRTVEQRLGRVEIQNRCLWLALLVACLCGAQSGKVPEVVRARSFQAVDEKGRPVAVLTSEPDAQGVAVLDARGRTVAALAVRRDAPRSPSLGLEDPDGKASISLGVAGADTGLSVIGPDGKTTLRLP